MKEPFDPTRHYPPRVLSKNEVKKLSAEDRRELLCRLSLLPSMTSADIGEIVGLIPQYVDRIIAEGSAAGIPSRRDIDTGDKTLPTIKREAQPDQEEWAWRLTHQSDQYLLRRFGSSLFAMIHKAQVLPFASESLLAMDETPRRETAAVADLKMVDHRGNPIDVKQMVVHADPNNPNGNVIIIGTNVEVPCKTKSEQQRINAIVNWIDARYEVTPGGWSYALPLIELDRDYFRHVCRVSEKTAETLDEISARQSIIKQMQDIASKLPFDTKKAPGDYDRFERAKQMAVQYWAEHAYKHAVTCRVCGQIEFTYLPFYQSLIDVKRQCEAYLASDMPESEKAAVCLKEMHRNPYFHIQLRDLGVAWSQPLVEWGQSLMHPRVGQFRRVASNDVATELFPAREVGEACEVLALVPAADGSPEGVKVRWVESRAEQTYPTKEFTNATVGPLAWDQIVDGLAAQLGLGPDCFNEIIPAAPISRVKRIGIDEYEVLHVE